MLGILFSLAVSTMAGQELTNLEIVQRFMRAAFPELQQDRLHVLVSVDTGYETDWHKNGIVYIRVKNRRASPEQTEPLLGGLFIFNANRTFIDQVSLSGEYVSSSRNSAVEKEAEGHPKWTDADLQSELTRAGAHYGPEHRAEFLAHLRLERFESVLGKVQSFDVRFEWRTPKDTGASVMLPQWVVDARVLDRAGTRICYALFFEPFEGRFLALSGRPCE
jgi:hypothetical protein